MAITIDTTTNAALGANNPGTFSKTVAAGSNRWLNVKVSVFKHRLPERRGTPSDSGSSSA